MRVHCLDVDHDSSFLQLFIRRQMGQNFSRVNEVFGNGLHARIFPLFQHQVGLQHSVSTQVTFYNTNSSLTSLMAQSLILLSGWYAQTATRRTGQDTSRNMVAMCHWLSTSWSKWSYLTTRCLHYFCYENSSQYSPFALPISFQLLLHPFVNFLLRSVACAPEWMDNMRLTG